MAISKKGSRKIVVEEQEFRWRTSGSDGKIKVLIWPVENDSCRIVSSMGYHNKRTNLIANQDSPKSQIIVTNRIIREVILHYGVADLLKSKGQINLPAIEEIYDVKKALRS